MRTLLIDTDRLGPVVLREPFQLRVDKNDQAIPDDTGQTVWISRIVIPGQARSIYSEQTGPALVRIKVTGNEPRVQPGPVHLRGRCTITAWALRGGGQYRSEVTVSAERVEPAHGAAPSITGMLPVAFPLPDAGGAAMVLGETVLTSGPWPYRAHLMLPPGCVEGLADVETSVSVAELVGSAVSVELDARLVVPDREDVGRTAKAELLLVGRNWQPVTGADAGRGGRRREVEPQQEAASEA